MRKKQMRGYILIALLFMIYIAAVTPFVKTAVFWIAFAFSMPAFLAQIRTVHTVMKSQSLIKDRIYDFPGIRISVLYLVLQLCASLVLMGFGGKVPVFAAVIIETVIFTAAVTGSFAIGSARTEAVRQDVQLEKELMKMKKLQAQVNLLASHCSDGEIKEILVKLAEEIRYSNPVSVKATEEIEGEISVLLTGLEALALDEDVENVTAYCERITGLLKERDRICRERGEHT